MNRVRLFPSSHDFFVDFAAAAANVQDTAAAAVALFAGERNAAERAQTLRDLEHRGDEITHAILTALSHSFVPAISPGDIRALAERLDDIVDDLTEAGHRYALYQLNPPLPPAQQLAWIVQAQSDVLVEAMALLPAGEPNAVMPLVVELHRLENEADEVLHSALAALYDGVTDVPEVIRAYQWGELYELLEQASDQVERVAHTVEDIVSQR